MDPNAQQAQPHNGTPIGTKPQKNRRKRLSFSKRNRLIALTILVLMAMGGFITYQQLQLNEYRNNPTKAAQEEQTHVLNLVRKLYQIPTYTTKVDGKDVTKEDTPEIASITDKSKLSGQAFFDKAENGDYIVVFPNTKLALIYREKTNQIINSGPVTVDANQQTSKLAVKIYGITKDRDAAQAKIDAAFPGSPTVTKADAAGKIAATIVVDISGKNATAATQLASKLTNATVGSVPSGEVTPTDVDIAIYTATE